MSAFSSLKPCQTTNRAFEEELKVNHHGAVKPHLLIENVDNSLVHQSLKYSEIPFDEADEALKRSSLNSITDDVFQDKLLITPTHRQKDFIKGKSATFLS